MNRNRKILSGLLAAAAVLPVMAAPAQAEYHADSDTGVGALDYIEDQHRAERENRLTDEQQQLLKDAATMQQHLRQMQNAGARPALISRLGALQQIIDDTPGIRLRTLSFDAARNALAVLHLFGRDDVPVYPGVDYPIAPATLPTMRGTTPDERAQAYARWQNGGAGGWQTDAPWSPSPGSVAVHSSSNKSLFSRMRIGCVSGSPMRQLNSSVLTLP